MQKLNVEEVTLKENHSGIIYNFCDVSVDFILLLLLQEKQQSVIKLAFFEEGTVLSDYSINLDRTNKRQLYARSFEFEPCDPDTELSLVLLENDFQEPLGRAKIKKLINQSVDATTEDSIRLHELVKFKVDEVMYESKTKLIFDNDICCIKLFLEK